MVSGVWNENKYLAIKYMNEAEHYPIQKLCSAVHIARSAYYKWLKRAPSQNQKINEQVVEWIKQHYEERNGILGYRQMTVVINREHDVRYNKKRIYRLMNILHLKSVTRVKKKTYIPSTPQITAENILNRDFHADKPNEKWLTDVTEFKYYVGSSVRKLYLSAILDLYDRRIVAYKISDINNNHLVFSTFDDAIRLNPDAHPIFHSDRGFQYTNKTFHQRLVDAGMLQSMSRVGRCIDNGPMEGWWGILKSEMYYLRKYTDKEELISAIKEYICYYNTKRYQINLNCMTPMEYHEAYSAA
ncbi:MAG: IS3 family transposase [Ruminococcus sp.]|nr:IS3 family transposase [Ruminococcus sp.]